MPAMCQLRDTLAMGPPSLTSAASGRRSNEPQPPAPSRNRTNLWSDQPAPLQPVGRGLLEDIEGTRVILTAGHLQVGAGAPRPQALQLPFSSRICSPRGPSSRGHFANFSEEPRAGSYQPETPASLPLTPRRDLGREAASIWVK